MKSKEKNEKKEFRKLTDEELEQVTGGAGILKQVGVATATVAGAANGLKSNQCPDGSTVAPGGLCVTQGGVNTPNF